MYRVIYIVGIAFILLAEIACAPIQRANNLNSVNNVVTHRDERIHKLKLASEEMLEALKSQEFDKFVDMIFPEAMNKLGGGEKFISVIKETYGPTLNGFNSVNISLQEPEKLVELENKLFGIVPLGIEGNMAQN